MEELRQFGTALLIGALVGLDREQKKGRDDVAGTRGIRSFVLLALAGALAGWLGRVTGEAWVLAAAVLAASGMLVAGYVVQVERGDGRVGLTTELSALVVLLLGAACALGREGVAVAVAVAVAVVLAFKEGIHGLVDRVGREDLVAGLQLLVATFIVLPLLPDRALDPMGVFNPRKVWLLVVLIAGLSLVGYVAVRWLGRARGLMLTGLCGGLVSSTAVTLAFAKRSREAPIESGALVAGVLVAWAVMFARVVGVLAVVGPPDLFGRVVAPFAAMAAASLVVAWVAGLRGRVPPGGGGPEVPFENPFSLWSASKFAALFVAVLFAVRLVERAWPPEGLLWLSGLAGLTDVDAITLSLAGYARGGGAVALAAAGVLAAALANTLFKLALLLGAGARRARPVAVVAACAVVGAGLAAHFAWPR